MHTKLYCDGLFLCNCLFGFQTSCPSIMDRFEKLRQEATSMQEARRSKLSWGKKNKIASKMTLKFNQIAFIVVHSDKIVFVFNISNTETYSRTPPGTAQRNPDSCLRSNKQTKLAQIWRNHFLCLHENDIF